MTRLALFVVLCVLAMPAWACRCSQRDLNAYFDGATEVGVGRFVGAADIPDTGLAQRRMLTFELLSPLHKSQRKQPLHSGDMVRYATSDSSAGCGVAPRPDDIVVFFARPLAGKQLGIDTCSGTRTLRSRDGDAVATGFQDVPGTHVIAQLDALAGLEYLRAMKDGWPDEDSPANGTLLGLVAIHTFEAIGENDVIAVPLRIAPSDGAAELARIRRYRDVQSRESDYEVHAAVVFARSQGWYRLQLEDGRFGWLAPAHAGAFIGYDALVVNRLNYIDTPWPGLVWPEPGAGLPMRIERPADEREVPVEVLETTRAGGTLWLRINVLKASPCHVGDASSVASGWIPAYRPNGEPAAWFYSRGC